MGLFGKKEDPEDLMYQAMAFLEKNQPKRASTRLKGPCPPYGPVAGQNPQKRGP